MDSPKFQIVGDCLFLETPQFDVEGTEFTSLRLIIDKETFKELYKLWIEPDLVNNYTLRKE